MSTLAKIENLGLATTAKGLVAAGLAGEMGYRDELRGTVPEPGSCLPELLLIEHLPMVRSVARQIHMRLPQHVELEDLISAGTMGLLDAVQKFDTTRKVQFRSYAQIRVRGAILDSLREVDWSPRELRRKARFVAEAQQAVAVRLGRTPVEGEVAEAAGMQLSEYQALKASLSQLEVESLHVERGEDGGEAEIAFLQATAADDPLHQCMEGQTREKLASAIEDLPERERLVLTLYYFEELTMKEIGLTLGVVESRVSQLHASAVRRLKASMGITGRSGVKQRPAVRRLQ